MPETIVNSHPMIVLFVLLTGIMCVALFWFGILYKLIHRNDTQWEGTRFLASFFTIIGALLGLILAMVLVTIWQNYQEEKEHITSEVSSYTNAYRELEDLPGEVQDTARLYLKETVKYIIHDSWMQMAKGEEGVREKESLERLIAYISRVSEDNENIKLTRRNILEKLEFASDRRRSRNLKGVTDMIPEVMWWVIGVCSVISILCGFFFPIRPARLHAILVSMHSAMIGIIIYLILVMMYPYRAPNPITPAQFEKLLNKTLPQIDREQGR